MMRSANETAVAAAIQTELERLVDEAFEAYLQWRGESLAVERAYARWNDAAVGERRAAFAVYRLALAGEERTAAGYEGLIAELRAARPSGRHQAA